MSLGTLFIKPFIFYGELAGIRTQDPRLKRALLYQLSYELSHILVHTQCTNVSLLHQTIASRIAFCFAVRIWYPCTSSIDFLATSRSSAH